MSDTDAITRALHAIDRLDWPAFRDCFADVITTDYTSLWGGEVETLPTEELITRWSEFADGLAATQHQTGPIVMTDGRAETHVIAYHWLPDGDTWVVHGHYVARLVDGKIAELTLQTLCSYGHDGLPTVGPGRKAVQS